MLEFCIQQHGSTLFGHFSTFWWSTDICSWQAVISNFIHEVAKAVAEISKNEVAITNAELFEIGLNVGSLISVAAQVHCSWHTHQVPPRHIHGCWCWKGGTTVAITDYQQYGAKCSKRGRCMSKQCKLSQDPAKVPTPTQQGHTHMQVKKRARGEHGFSTLLCHSQVSAWCRWPCGYLWRYVQMGLPLA